MTTGIYFLEIGGEYYIGQSVNIEVRVYKHRYSLQKGSHYNYKLQSSYDQHKNMADGILEVCTIEELNQKEINYITEFDSIQNGLNIVDGGSGAGFGYTASGSKYTKEQILLVFDLLADISVSFSEISEIAEVDQKLPSSICNKLSHAWLEEAYPQAYAKMLEVASLRKQKMLPYALRDTKPVVRHLETGRIEEVHNPSTFAKTEGLCVESLRKLILGDQKTHRGWVRNDYLGPKENMPFYIRHSDTNQVEQVVNIKETAEKLGLNRCNLSNLKAGRQKIHKRWVLHDE